MKLVSCLFVVALCSLSAQAQEARLEGGLFRTESNRFNIPNPGGSRVLVQEEMLKPYLRAEGRWQLSERSALRLLVAPLRASYRYTPQAPLAYNGRTFPAGSTVAVDYTFHSYRLGYLYRALQRETWSLEVGAVAKVRQASITVSGGGQETSYDNVGFVPLAAIGARWKFSAPWELRFALDGAAAPQGRAFDGNLELFHATDEAGSGYSAGVRVLEGGADNGKVNTFALFQYLYAALTFGF